MMKLSYTVAKNMTDSQTHSLITMFSMNVKLCFENHIST